jgi:PIN domain nuclease of toxin-antitoxin system
LRLLLDTQVVWWLLTRPERLRRSVAEQLATPAALLHYSPLSFLELAIKRSKGGIDYKDSVLLDGVDHWRMVEVPVRRAHAVRAGSLPRHHGDPFDRLIIAQAIEEAMTVVSSDGVFRRYDVPLLSA